MSLLLAVGEVVAAYLGYALQFIGSIATLCLLFPVTFPIHFVLLRQPFRRALAFTGMSNLFLFMMSVSIPYHFQGYSELISQCQWYSAHLSCPHAPFGDPTGNGMGLTRIPGIDAISYGLNLGLGLPVLITSSICIIAGNFTNYRVYDLAIKSMLLAFAIWSSQNLYLYQVIADWTD